MRYRDFLEMQVERFDAHLMFEHMHIVRPSDGAETLVLYRLQWVDELVPADSFIVRIVPDLAAVRHCWLHHRRIDLSRSCEQGTLCAPC